MIKKQLIATFILLLISYCGLLAQTRNITGTVKDARENPVVGATVAVKGTNRSVATNEKGAFSIRVEGKGELEISSIGFATQSVKVIDSDNVNISLVVAESKSENEVVVIGYGKTTKRLVTTSISSIPVDKLQNRASGSIESLLQGLAPGLLVQNNSGAPGGRSNIQVRGLSNFSADANSNVVSTPLFIIDGVPLEQDAFNPSNPRQAITSVLSGINPFDLESVDVLKDAAATAIYGSRGANGVILITTKRGKVGKPIVSVNTQYGKSYYPQLRKTLGGNAEREFKINLYNQYAEAHYGGVFGNPLPIELADSLNPYYNNSTNWQKLYFQDAGLSDINIGVSGATETASYRIGASYYNEKGIVAGSGFKRYSLTYTGVFNPTKGLTITGRANLSQTDASQKRGDTYGAALAGNGFSSSLYPGPSSDYTYNFIEAYKQGVNLDLTRRIVASLEASYDITDFLNLSSRGSASYKFYRTRFFNPSAANANGKPSANYYSEENVEYLSETTLRLHKIFNQSHTFDWIFGNTINTKQTDNIFGSAFGGPNDAQQVIQGYPQENITLNTNNVRYGLLSYFSRLSYDYKRKYIFSAVLRADASSKFGKDNQWGYFPSGSAGWVFTSEPFFKNNVGNWFSFGKIRASAGKAGEQYEDNYLALGAYNVGGTYNGVPIVAPNYGGGNGIPLPNLTWQETKEYGAGIDLEFFKGRITTSFDYYNKTKNGFLFTDPLQSTSGYATRYVNSGAVRNTGFDLVVTGYLTRPENRLQYSMTLIGSANKNKLTKLPDLGRSITRSNFKAGQPYLQVGQPLNGFYLLKYLGVYPDDASVPFNPYTGGKLRPFGLGFSSQDPYRGGDIMLYDANGDYVIQTTGDDDKVYMGSPNPKLYGSFSHSLTYKLKNESSIQLNFMFNYSIGAKVYNQVLLDRLKSVSWTGSQNVSYPGGQINLLDVSDLDYWTPNHTNAKYPSLNPWRYYAQSSYDFIGNYDNNTSLFLESGDFIRLNNINIAYDFNPGFLRKMNFRRLRVFAGMDNVFIIKKYSGVDPENVNDYGYDQGNGYPIPKKFNLGFNFEF